MLQWHRYCRGNDLYSPIHLFYHLPRTVRTEDILTTKDSIVMSLMQRISGLAHWPRKTLLRQHRPRRLPQKRHIICETTAYFKCAGLGVELRTRQQGTCVGSLVTGAGLSAGPSLQNHMCVAICYRVCCVNSKGYMTACICMLVSDRE